MSRLPDGEAGYEIGSSRIAVMGIQRFGYHPDVDGTASSWSWGQTRAGSSVRGMQRLPRLGIPLYDADFQRSTLKFLGSTGDKGQLRPYVKTSQQVPSFLLDRLMPASVNAVTA